MEITPKLYVTSFDLDDCLGYVEKLKMITDTFGPEQTIVVQIESYGGSVDGFFVIYDALKTITNPIITYTTGVCASAGLFLFTSCATPIEMGGVSKPLRIVGENASLMFHGIQFYPPGGDLKDVNELNRHINRINDTLLNIARKSLNLSSVDELLKKVREKTDSHDLYMNAKTAVELGFADKIGAIKLSPIFAYDIGIMEVAEENEKCDCGKCEDDILLPKEEKKPKKNKKRTNKK